MSTVPYKRPFGVTIRGLFYIIEGAIAILFGILLSTATRYIETYLNRLPQRQEFFAVLQILDSNLSHVLIIWLTVAGSSGIVIGIGVLQGKKWAWKITIIQTVLSITAGLVYLSYTNISDPTSKLIGTSTELIIGIVIICYFFQPHVRAYFNRLSIP